MTFAQQLKIAKTFVGARVKITDQRTYSRDTAETGICIDVVKWPDAYRVDFVLENKSRYGMILEEVSHDRCSGDAGALGRFNRTVERLS